MKIGIAGATGYTGAELLKIISHHPSFELSFATSERFAGRKIGEVFPFLSQSKVSGVELVRIEDAFSMDADGVFLALPHERSSQVAPEFLKGDRKVVDLSAAFRLKDLSIYNSFYGKHWSPELIQESVYGIPELFRNDIKKAKLVANPGCYPTSVIIPVYPLVKEGVLKERIIVDAKSGVSGAGREPSLGTLFSEVNESVKPYKTGVHRHQPEMEEILGIEVFFSPHLAPMDRGILSSIYIFSKLSADEVLNLLMKYYSDEPFVRVYKDLDISTKQVRGSNFIDISVRSFNGVVVIFSVVDNLVKGASGQAVQNMNIMLGEDETQGLKDYPVFP